MKSITAQRDQFKIALAYLAKLQAEHKPASLQGKQPYVSPYVRRAFLRANGGK